MNKIQIEGLLRTLAPIGTLFLSRYIPPEIAGPVVQDLITGIVTLGAAGWSIQSNRLPSLVQQVVSQPGTSTGEQGQKITLHTPQLQQAAIAAATDAEGKKL